MHHAITTLSNKPSFNLAGAPQGWSAIRRCRALTKEERNSNAKMANTNDKSNTASEMDDDDYDTVSEMADDEMTDDDEDASLKQVVWKDIEVCLRCLSNSSNDKDRLEQMTKASIALFVHIASEESVDKGAPMWKTICEDDHLHSMFRGITVYRHILHLGTTQFQTSKKDETEMENAHQGCLIQAWCHWWAGLSAFSEKHWNAMQQKVFKELNLENWRNIEKNLAMLKPQEQAMIEAALTAYNHTRVLTYIRQEAQKIQTSLTYLTYITKQDFPMDLKQSIDNFLKRRQLPLLP
jgi:hypothetical protein